MTKPTRVVRVLSLGQIDYTKALDIQKKCIELVKSRDEDFLVMQEHPPTITLGKNATEQDLVWNKSEFGDKGIAIVATDRGGKLTAHNPGQLVGYPIFNLEVHKLRTRAFVTKVEQALQKTLQHYGIDTTVFDDRPGLWSNEKKIAALGFRIEGRISSHGFAINVNNDLGIFKTINPCGFSSSSVTSMAHTLKDTTPAISDVSEVITKHIAQSFEQKVETIDNASFLQ